MGKIKTPVVMCHGEYIGIETIYSVIGGKQINIPGKVETLRAKGRYNELVCTCGCGTNYIVAAKDHGVYAQHFKKKRGQGESRCNLVVEGWHSIDSKIVLKCWLDDNFGQDVFQSRVPICSVDDSDRKYEFSFLSKEKGIAVDYCYNRTNLSDEKLDVLDANTQNIRIIHIVDEQNFNDVEQYPEFMTKVERRQGYCLYLEVDGHDYARAYIKATYHEKSLEGYWEEIELVRGKLSDFKISDDASLMIGNEKLTDILERKQLQYSEKREKIRKEKEREEKLAQEKRMAAAQRMRELNEQRQKQKRIQEELIAQCNRPKEANLSNNIGVSLRDENSTDAKSDLRTARKTRMLTCDRCGEVKAVREFWDTSRATYGSGYGRCEKCHEEEIIRKMKK